jgi:hypothetical protein
MKIKNIKDPEAFFQVVDKCSGKIELVTDEGDRLNLKSKLCQLISLTSVFSLDASSIPEMEIIAYEADDAKKLLDFIVNQ